MADQPAMICLRPGDRVLVTLTDDPDPETLADIAAGLRKGFPGVDFTVISGIASLAVMDNPSRHPINEPANDTEQDTTTKR